MTFPWRFTPLHSFNHWWQQLPVRTRGSVIVAVPAACLAITLGAWIWSRQAILEIRNQIDQTEALVGDSHILLNEVINAETSVRGYTLTKDASFLETYRLATQALPNILAQLNPKLMGNAAELQQMQAIDAQIRERLAILEQLIQTVNAEGQTGVQPPRVLTQVYDGKEVMDAIRDNVRAFQALQEQKLDRYAQVRNNLQEITGTVLWFTAIVSLLGSLAAIYLFRSVDEELQIRARLLNESKSLLQAIFNNVVDGVITLDEDGNVELTNPTVEAMFGYSAAEMAGKGLDAFLANSSGPNGRDATSQIDVRQYSAERGRSWKSRGRCKNGTTFPIEISVSEISLDQRLVAIIRDTSSFEKAEAILQARADELARLSTVLAQTNATLEDRNKELEQFAYVASHDLKAPLRAIANLSEWIEEDLADKLPDENRHQMTLLRGRVLRMEALINGLLDYSRVGRIETKVETVSVQELLDEVIDSLAPPKTFTIHIGPNMPTLTTKRLPLQQVFANLISNAIKHHDHDNGTIDITAVDRGDTYEFSVHDDGPGIDPAFHDKVFAMFQTLHARDTVENTGIGLSIVKKIIDLEGGTIGIRSTEGHGATFYFTWPKQPANP